MALQEIHLNEYAKVEADLEKGFVRVTWLQHTSGAPLRAVLVEALQYARAHGLNRWLYDMRKINYTTVADQSWTAKEFFPSFDHRLHHRLACVASPENVDLLPDALISDSIRQSPVLAESIEMKVFLNPEMAQYWLFM
jgi:hypothetical protein